MLMHDLAVPDVHVTWALESRYTEQVRAVLRKVGQPNIQDIFTALRRSNETEAVVYERPLHETNRAQNLRAITARVFTETRPKSV